MSDRSVSVCVTHLIVVYIICFIHIQIVPAIHLTIAFHFNWLNALEKLKIFNPDEYPEKLIRNITQIPLSIVAGCAIQKDEPNLSEQQNSKKQKRKKKTLNRLQQSVFPLEVSAVCMKNNHIRNESFINCLQGKIIQCTATSPVDLHILPEENARRTHSEIVCYKMALLTVGWIGLDWIGLGVSCVCRRQATQLFAPFTISIQLAGFCGFSPRATTNMAALTVFRTATTL